MYIKIYFGDKPVFLCDEINAAAINSLLHEIKKEEFHAGVIWNTDLDKLKKAFFKHFTLIEAAGGILQNHEKEILVIYRLNKWDLPKGKLEEDEKLEACAVREVEEETGATNIKLKKKAGETYHTYNAYGKHFLKISHWYYMSCSGVQNLVPQAVEDITALKWVAPQNLEEVLSNTYPSVKDILSVFGSK